MRILNCQGIHVYIVGRNFITRAKIGEYWDWNGKKNPHKKKTSPKKLQKKTKSKWKKEVKIIYKT